MTATTRRQFILRTLDDTDRLAQSLVEAVGRHAVIGLVGDLGAGKTTFSTRFATHVGVRDTVASPTFTLLNEYRLSGQRVFIHADMYRLRSLGEARQLGLTDYFTDTYALILIEWADKIRDLMPAATIWLTFEVVDHDDERRVVTIDTEETTFWPLLEKARRRHYDA